MTTTNKVRRMLAQGLSAPEIAKKLKIKPAYVHTVKWLDKKKAQPKKIKVGRKEILEEVLPAVSKLFGNKVEKKPKEDPKAKEWAKKNPWFGVSKPRTAYALGLHDELVRSGVDAKSDEYYQKIDKGMRAFNKPLTATQKAIARKLGLTGNEFLATDPVNHPPHYKSGGVETIDFIEAKDLNYRLGNVVKYVSRAGRKDTDPVQDLEKAAWYLQREITARKNA